MIVRFVLCSFSYHFCQNYCWFLLFLLQIDSICSVNMVKRKGIRNLASPRTAPVEEAKRCSKFIRTAVAIAVAGILIIVWKNERFQEDLRHLAMDQFQFYLYGRQNYCEEQFEHWHISNALRHRVTGQSTALDDIDSALQKHSNVTSMAFVGTQGVGKTLTLSLIKDHFQWHLNIQHYTWSKISSPEMQFNSLLKLIVELTTCGQNGIFVDGIPLESRGFIDEFNQRLLTYSQFHIRILAVFVFQANHPNANVQIKNITTIRFKQFDNDDVRNCIALESDRLKITVSPEQIEALVETIDAKRHGCKSVAAKIARQEFEDL